MLVGAASLIAAGPGSGDRPLAAAAATATSASLESPSPAVAATARHAQAAPIPARAAAAVDASAVTEQAPLDDVHFRERMRALRVLIEAGRYTDAEPLALDLIRDAEAWRPDDLPMAEAIDVLLEVRGRTDNSHLPRTLDYGRLALAIKEARLGADAAGVAVTLTRLATALRLTNHAAEARALCERALAIQERRSGLASIEAARVLTELGAARQALQDRSGATAALERALAIIEGTADRPAGAGASAGAAAASPASAASPGTAPPGTAAPVVEDVVRAPGATGVDLSFVLFRLGTTLAERANLAQRWYERAIAVDDRTYPPGHVDRARALNGLAASFADQDNIPAAAEAYTRVVALEDRALGPDHAMLALPLSYLCQMLTMRGDYVGALRQCDRAFEIATRRFGPDHSRTATVLDAQFRLHMVLGDQPGALERLERSRALLEQQTPVDTLRLVGVLNNLALAHEQMGEIDTALALTTRALDELARIGQHDAAWLVPPLTNQARLLARQQRPAEARAAVARALALAEPVGSWMQLYSVKTSAFVAQWQGDAAASIPGYRRTIALWEALSGPEDVQALEPRTWLAAALAQTGDFAAARREIAIIDASGLANLRTTARGLEEQQALGYARQMLSGRNLALSMLAHERTPAPADTAAAFDAIVRSRAVVLDEMAARRRAVAQAEPRPDLQARWTALAAARSRLARLVVSRVNGAAPEERERQIVEARAARDAAERALAEVSATFRDEQQQDRAGAAEVIAALPPQTALLAFVRYTPSPLKAGPLPQNPDDAYAAFVVSSSAAAGGRADGPGGAAAPAVPRAARSSGGEGADAGSLRRVSLGHDAGAAPGDRARDLIFIPLGSAAEIDARVAAWRAAIDAAIASGGVAPRRTEAAYREAGAALRARIWDPVRAAIGDASRVLIVPDAALHLVDFQVLPAPDAASDASPTARPGRRSSARTASRTGGDLRESSARGGNDRTGQRAGTHATSGAASGAPSGASSGVSPTVSSRMSSNGSSGITSDAAAGTYMAERGPALHYLLAERDLLRPAVAQHNLNVLALGNPDFTRSETIDWTAVRAGRLAPPPGVAVARAGGDTPGDTSGDAQAAGQAAAVATAPAADSAAGATRTSNAVRPLSGAAGPALAAKATAPDASTSGNAAPRDARAGQAGAPSDAPAGAAAQGAEPAAPLAPIDDGLDGRRVSRSACDVIAAQSFEPLPGAHRETQRIIDIWGRLTPSSRRARLEDYPRPTTGAAALMLTDAQASEAAFKTLAPGQGILHIATHGFFMDGDCQGDRPAAASRAASAASSASVPVIATAAKTAGARTAASAAAASSAVASSADVSPTAATAAATAGSATQRAVAAATPASATAANGVTGVTAGVRTNPRQTSRSAQFSDESPLLRAGLVLAGANRRAEADVNDDDGMLTAEEIAGLDLSATEWAVLSACDTGRGDWQAGEGMMGLRRAFQIAGARTVIMSLWAVDDAVSARWMTALYEERFLRGASTVDAVRGAGRALLADRRARGLSTHPIYWAGFIAAGDWR